MKLTLWLLNRCVDWEEHRQGAMANALRQAGHDVTTGQRCFAAQEAAVGAGGSDLSAPIDRRVVNVDADSPVGALMHEGEPWDTPSYDEYFVPIALKCIGDPWAGSGPSYSDFWKTELRYGREALFGDIVGPIGASSTRANRYFAPEYLGAYWTEMPRNATTAGPSFGNVRMNTGKRRGYYQILREHTMETGRKNVLVGYSQGGTVARYLAFLDEYVSGRRDNRCIHGVVTVQSPLRGSPIASVENADPIAEALTSMALSLGHFGARDGNPDDAVFTRTIEAPPAPPAPPAPLTFTALAQLIDALIVANRANARNTRSMDVLRTVRKWISGLMGDHNLAFYDLDPYRLDVAGSVLNSIATHPMRDVWHGAIIGADTSLEAFVSGLLSGSAILSTLEWLFRFKLRAQLKPAENIYRLGVMSVQSDTPQQGSPILDTLRRDMEEQAPLPLRGRRGFVKNAHDFVIPSASQVMLDTGARFLGNLVNADASHLSGARLETSPDNDLDLACTLLKGM